MLVAGGVTWLAGFDHRARSMAGKNFQQQGVGDPTIENMRGFGSIFHRAQAGFELGDHSATHNFLTDHLVRLCGSDTRTQRAILI